MQRPRLAPHSFPAVLAVALSAVPVLHCASADLEGDRWAGGEFAPGDASGGANAGNSPAPGQLTAGVWDDNRNYDQFLAYLEETGQIPGAPQLDDDERHAANADFTQEQSAKQHLDIAIVLDTTGSMGDELTYLRSEIDELAANVATIAPSADVRWGLVLYRDEGDEYVTRSFPFTTSLSEFRAKLGAQSADGGGDYPEASHKALADLMQLSWRSGADVARMAFFFTDAPHHVSKAPELTAALRSARAADVHLYPVAASGVDELAETTLRQAAQFTGGRYLFLTDDSGIGNTHKEPSIPCYFVTLLLDAMSRMIEIELTGVYREPASSELIRSAGKPADGVCVLDDDETVSVF